MRDDQLLMIAYYFPPIQSIGVVRNSYIANQFSKISAKVEILTTSNVDLLPNETIDISEKIKVTKVFTFDYRTFFAKRRNKKSTHFTEEQKSTWLGRFTVKLLRSFPFNLLIGEGGFFYIINGVINGYRKIRPFNARTILYSSFPTYSDHAIAFILKLFFPSTFWFADFRDLHTDPIYEMVYFKPFQHWSNKFFLSRADLVTTVSNGLADQLQAYHPNIHVLRNGVEIYPKGQVERHSKFTITYTGSLFMEERDPSPLLRALKELMVEHKINQNQIQLIYAGKDGIKMEAIVKKNKLSSIFINQGMLTRKEALDLQKRTHINLLLSSAHKNMKGVFTGKFFEYLSTRNPILLLIKGIKDEEFESVFQQINAGFIAYDHPGYLEQIKRYILKLYEDWATEGDTNHQIDEEALRSYFSWEKSISDLFEKMDYLDNNCIKKRR